MLVILQQNSNQNPTSKWEEKIADTQNWIRRIIMFCETWIWRTRGVPVMTWWATHGCNKDRSFGVRLRYEAIRIHVTIPQSVAPCHIAMLSIPFSLSLSLSFFLSYLSQSQRRIEREEKKNQTSEISVATTWTFLLWNFEDFSFFLFTFDGEISWWSSFLFLVLLHKYCH